MLLYRAGFTKIGSDSSVSILDTSNFSWVQSFQPPTSGDAPTPSVTQTASATGTQTSTQTGTQAATVNSANQFTSPPTTVMFVGIACGVTVAIAAITVLA